MKARTPRRGREKQEEEREGFRRGGQVAIHLLRLPDLPSLSLRISWLISESDIASDFNGIMQVKYTGSI